MNYRNLLEHSYKIENDNSEYPMSRLEFLSGAVFNFTTYDSAMDELLSQKAVDVCVAITNNKTFEYQRDSEDNYRWYIIMCNMPFFKDKLGWGMSIRGAWWNISSKKFNINSCSLYEGHEQLLDIEFDENEWSEFVGALNDFADTQEKINSGMVRDPESRAEETIKTYKSLLSAIVDDGGNND